MYLSYLHIGFVGALSVALHRDDPTRQHFLKVMEKICRRHISTRKLLDLQFVVMLLYDTSTSAWGFLSDRQEHQQRWFQTLASCAQSNEPDTPEVTDDFLLNVLIQSFRRMMLYNFDKHLPLTDFESRRKTCRSIRTLEVIVVSICYL